MQTNHVVLASLLCAGALGFGVVACLEVQARENAASAEPAADWIVDRGDNICGLCAPHMLSNPARVQYPLLLAATPELRRIEAEGIDPTSPIGIALRQAGVDRVHRACELVRVQNGYCSVWKLIRHRDGRAVPDVTELARPRL
jgi:hypothetical protein